MSISVRVVRWWIAGIFLLCVLMACAPMHDSHFSSTSTIQASPSPRGSSVALYRSVQPFHEIVIHGNMRVDVQGHAMQNDVQVIRPEVEKPPRVSVYVFNGVLYLNRPSHFWESNAHLPVHVRVMMAGPLNRIEVSGIDRLQFQSIDAQQLYFFLSDHAHVELVGDLLLDTIHVEDHASLLAYWLNSTYLNVLARANSHVRLSGIVTHLTVDARSNAHVDARYLNTKEAFVKAEDHATVNVRTNHALSAWATESATINYYKDPSVAYGQQLNRSGSVLRRVGVWY